jgi:hypothetical protein
MQHDHALLKLAEPDHCTRLLAKTLTKSMPVSDTQQLLQVSNCSLWQRITKLMATACCIDNKKPECCAAVPALTP